MKKILCKFANWILRKCTNPEIVFNTDVYINGRTYTYIEHFGDLGRNKVRKESTKFVYKTLLKLLDN